MGSTRGLHLPMVTLSSFLHNFTSLKPKENHHPLIFVVDFDNINSMTVKTLGKMDIPSYLVIVPRKSFILN